MSKSPLLNLLILNGFSSYLFLAAACTQPKQMKQNQNANTHNSQNSIDWAGIYSGLLPCADCRGMQTTIFLNKDHTYRTKIQYLGKNENVKEYSGKFSWNAEGNAITLASAPLKEISNKYLVGENTLTALDENGSKIPGDSASDYILSKANYAILEKYWKLVELNGKPVNVDSTFSREPHIILKSLDNRVNGNGGCNTIAGTFEVRSPNRISFSRVVATRMACPQMDLEAEFLKVLDVVDNFNVVGDMLVLSKARMAPLARFKTVYMKN